MKIENIELAAVMAKNYKTVNDFIGLIDPKENRECRISLTRNGQSLCWPISVDEYLAALLSRGEQLKKELAELGVEV
jgi:hypothetical protein